jgi:hypothetical protein
MQFKEFKTESSEDPLYLKRGVSKAWNIGIVGPIERAFCLRSTLWPHVTKKRPERIKVVPITLPNNPQQSMVHKRVKHQSKEIIVGSKVCISLLRFEDLLVTHLFADLQKHGSSLVCMIVYHKYYQEINYHVSKLREITSLDKEIHQE